MRTNIENIAEGRGCTPDVVTWLLETPEAVTWCRRKNFNPDQAEMTRSAEVNLRTRVCAGMCVRVCI